MSKEKLFTPEDFDKPKEKSFWQKYKGWIIGIAVIIIIAAIVICYVFCGKTQDKEENEIEQDHTELVTAGAETQVSNEGSGTIEIGTDVDSQETEQLEEQSTPAIDAEREKKLGATSMKPVAHPAIVSDNIEREAMNVIRGNYGNIPERREKLGSKYQEIQNRVNELKREGAF